jgi:multidrug transporter EmrE-like cation transporter
MIISWIYAFGSVFLTGVGQTLLKIGSRKVDRNNQFISSYLNPYVIFAYGLFVIVTILSVFALKEISLKIFYSFTSLNFFLVLVFSYFILKEPVNKGQILGIGLIVLGIIVFNL